MFWSARAAALLGAAYQKNSMVRRILNPLLARRPSGSGLWGKARWLALGLLLLGARLGWAQPTGATLYFASDEVRLPVLVERKQVLDYRVELMGERRYRETFFDSADLFLHQQGRYFRVKESFDGKAQLDFDAGGWAQVPAGQRVHHSIALTASKSSAARAGRFDKAGVLEKLPLPAGRDFTKVQLVAEYSRHSIALTRSSRPEFVVSLLVGSFEGFSGRKLRKKFWALEVEPVGRRTSVQLPEIKRISDYLINALTLQRQANSLYAEGVEKAVLLRPDERLIEAVNIIGGSRGKSLDQFDEPDAVAFTLDGRLIAGDTENARFKIYRFDDRFQSVQIVGAEGSGAGEFGHGMVVKILNRTIYHQVQGIAVDKNGLIYVIDQGNQRVQVFADDGKALPERAIALKFCPAELPHCAEGLWRPLKGEYSSLQGLAVDQDGGVFVADRGISRIYRYLPTGQLDPGFHFPALHPLTNKPIFQQPESMALYQDKLFVANEGTGDIKILDRLSGKPIGPPAGFGADVFAGDVEGLAVVQDYLFAVDGQNTRIAAFDLKTTPPKFLMGFVGDHESADGIAVDPTGKFVALADQGNLRVILYSLRDILNHLAMAKPKR